MKYMSIGSLAILAAGFSFPQAFAHVTNSLSHNMNHVMEALGIIDSNVDAIKAKTDNLPNDPADQSLIDSQLEGIQSDTDKIQTSIGSISGGSAPKTARVATIGNPVDGNFFVTDIMPLEEEKTYSGIVSGVFSLSVGSRGFVTCNMAGDLAGVQESINLVIVERTDITQNSRFTVNEFFACDRLRIAFHDLPGDGDVGPAGFAGNVQYFESNDIIEVTS